MGLQSPGVDVDEYGVLGRLVVPAITVGGLIIGLLLGRVVYYAVPSMEETPWTLGETEPAEDETVFGIRVVHPCPPNGPPIPGGGEYSDMVQLEIEETAESITIVARAPVPRGVACNFSLHYLDVTVELGAPLGGRSLIGADGRY